MRHQTPSPAPPPFRSHHASLGYSMNAVLSDAAIGLSAAPRLHDLDVRADFLEQGLRHVGHAVHRAPEFHVLAIFALGQNPEGVRTRTQTCGGSSGMTGAGGDRSAASSRSSPAARSSTRSCGYYREVFAWAATMS